MNTSSNDSKPESSNTVKPDESTTTPTGKPLDSHREIASQWINSAMKGIKEMHENEEARQDVAKRLF
jgi:hypothetical protein